MTQFKDKNLDDLMIPRFSFIIFNKTEDALKMNEVKYFKMTKEMVDDWIEERISIIE